MRVLAIDPGPTLSGWCLLEDGVPTRWGHYANEDLRADLIYSVHGVPAAHLVIEDVGNYGMAVGRDTFETVKWMGRFQEIQEGNYGGGSVTYIPRPTIKTHLCGVASAKDANVRQALIDRFGGDAVAIGGKKCARCKGKGWVGRGRPPCPDCAIQIEGINEREETVREIINTGYETPPGPLYGITSHAWSALAVGVTYLDMKEQADVPRSTDRASP